MTLTEIVRATLRNKPKSVYNQTILVIEVWKKCGTTNVNKLPNPESIIRTKRRLCKSGIIGDQKGTDSPHEP